MILLDDGFQHRRLRRDADIVLVSALDPFGGGRLLPSGDLREPKSALRRAHLVLITHADQVPEENLAALREEIESLHPGVPVAESVHKPDFLLDLREDRRRRLSHLKGRAAACVSGIGDPRPFESQLRRIGADLQQAWRFPDHHAFSREEILSIESVRRGMPLVTTFKDFPRLPEGWETLLTGEVLALGIRLDIVSGRREFERIVTGSEVEGDGEAAAEAEAETA